MSLQSVHAREGVAWIQQAFALFMKHPIGFAGLFSASMLVMMLVMLMPVVGVLFVLMAVPWLSLGFMQASRLAMDGKVPLVSIFFLPLRTKPSRVRALLLLGASYLAAAFVMVLLANWLDGGALAELVQKSVEANGDAQQLILNPEFQSAVALRLGMSAVLAIPFWHAPPLVYWGAQPVGRAVVFSLMAMWRNRMAFVVYALAWALVLMVLALTCSVILDAAGLSALLPVVSLIFMTVLSTVFYISTYFSFAGCFWPQTQQPSTS